MNSIICMFNIANMEINIFIEIANIAALVVSGGAAAPVEGAT